MSERGSKGKALPVPGDGNWDECHARPRTLLQGCDCVCLVRLSKVKPGRKLGAQETKSPWHQVSRGSSSLPRRVNTQSLSEEAAAKCGSCQAENLCESIAVAGKSESVLRAAVAACLSLVFAARWEKPA